MKFVSALLPLSLALSTSASATPALKKRDPTAILDSLAAVDGAVQVLAFEEGQYTGGATDPLETGVDNLLASISAAIAQVTATAGPYNLDDSAQIAASIPPIITDAASAISGIGGISTLLPTPSVSIVISDLSELYSAVSTLAGVLSSSAAAELQPEASSLSTSVLDVISTGLSYYGQPTPAP